ncbi:MAG: cysteine desulfurase [Parcubacteria group bacterium Gr01-1014_19]|nr:MAG: cysteine desulfurase [Parcubacteria group bacterium Gr01-1014_19]
MRKVYLDHAASTPVDPRVEASLRPYFGKYFGNPHSIHQFGQATSRAVFEARKDLAQAIGASHEEIVFTGSATEANNLAIRGIWKGLRGRANLKKPRIITFSLEHESILNTCKDLASEGVETIVIPSDRQGFIDLAKFKKALNADTFLVSVMHANNEVGTIQPVAAIAAEIRNWKLKTKSDIFPVLHTDAVQSFQYLNSDVNGLGIDLMTLSAHKIYGPKGVGALYVRESIRAMMRPIITGTGQEGGLRSGTDNVPYMVAFAKAAGLAVSLRAKESARVQVLRDYFWKQLKKLGPKVLLNGSLENRLPNNLNIYFPGHKAHDLLIQLDLLGIGVSPGAACSSRVSKGSYVLEEMGFPPARTSGSLRFSLGRATKKADIDYTISVIMKVLG